MAIDRNILEKVLNSEIVTGEELVLPRLSGISIDSRTLKEGELFFAIIGDNNNGHDFVADVIEKGAVAAVVNKSQAARFKDINSGRILVVNDTHEALLNLAGYIRRRTDAGFMAVTGSNGKTTTKEMLYAILNSKYKSFRSPGNLNNLFGLPLSLGMMPDETEYAIFELGISTPGEMTRLARIIKPELALIINIGPAHLETLGSLENVVRAKFELIDNLPVGATVVLNADDKNITDEAKKRNLNYIGFGIENDCQFQASGIGHDDGGRYFFDLNQQTYQLKVCGQVNIYNALAAMAASSVWGCGPDEWHKGLDNFEPVSMRMGVEQCGSLKLLVDCYNANPDSVAASLACFGGYQCDGRKIAVLGDMLELGQDAKRFHLEAGEQVAGAGVDFLLCLGSESVHIAEGAMQAGLAGEAVSTFDDHEKILSHLLQLVQPGDMILFKGSRGMALEKIVNGLKLRQGEK